MSNPSNPNSDSHENNIDIDGFTFAAPKNKLDELKEFLAKQEQQKDIISKAVQTPKPQDTQFSDKQWRVVTIIEQTFWETGEIPTNEAVAQKCAQSGLPVEVSYVVSCWKNEKITEFLGRRGITLNTLQSRQALVLDPKQLALINMLLNYEDSSSVREKCKALGITTQKYHAWLRQPAFQKHLQARVAQVHEQSDNDAYLGLAQAISDGDLSAIKFHFEMRGIYNPRIQVDVNISQVLVVLVEILQKHVKDPETLLAISKDIENVMSGLGNNALAAIPVESLKAS